MIRMSDISPERRLKGILTFLFLVLSLALIITWNTPATGYESSIYRSTPLILWVSIIASVITGTSLVVLTIAKNELKEHQLWKAGLLLIILSYVVCLGLFIIRGYYMWCMNGDPAEHIGWIKETLSNGNFPNLVYPITHIYLSYIVLFTGLDLVILHKIIPLIFGLLCVLFMYILAETIFRKKSVSLLVAIIGCCLAYSWYIRLTPNILANFYLPLVIYLVYKNIQQKNLPWATTLIISIVIMPVFHTVPYIILVTLFISIFISAFFSNLFNNQRQREKINYFNSVLKSLIIPFIILISVWIFWFSLFSIWNSQIVSAYGTITQTNQDIWLDKLEKTTAMTELYGYSVINQIIRNLWGPIILGLMSILSFPLIICDFVKSKKNPYILSILITFTTVIILSALFWRFDLGFTPQRLLFIISMFGTFLSAYLLSFLLISEIKIKNIFTSGYVKSAIVIIIICILFIGGLATLYPSPYILSENWQNTQYEVEGILFVFHHRDESINLTGITSVPERFAFALLSSEEISAQKLSLYHLGGQTVPYRFGYDSHSSISSIFYRETDLIITQRDRRYYLDTLPEIENIRYTRQDFGRLMIDPGIHLLYSNGEFDFFKTNI